MSISNEKKDMVRVAYPEEYPGIAVVTLDATERRNALGRHDRNALLETSDALMHDDTDVQAIVLTGAGGHFCAGANVGELGVNTILQGRHNLEIGYELVGHLVAGPKPVIAAVEGIAYGMGMSLAIASDVVVAAKTARFCAAFIRIGLLPDTGILWTLPRRVGMAKARELLSLAPEVDGAGALQIGLADQIAETGDALQVALQHAAELMKKPQPGMAMLKTALAYRVDAIHDSLQAELDYQSVLLQRAVAEPSFVNQQESK